MSTNFTVKSLFPLADRQIREQLWREFSGLHIKLRVIHGFRMEQLLQRVVTSVPIGNARLEMQRATLNARFGATYGENVLQVSFGDVFARPY